MHSVPLVPGEKGTLLDFAAKSHPEVLEVRGRKACEGGFLHRLDYHTSGLLLAARTQKAFDDLSCQQENGLLVKEYLAAARAGSPPAGFPPFPGLVRRLGRAFIESSFRHWGPGRRAVRPSSFPGIFYRTEILSSRQEADGNLLFHLLLVRGYRHQIRCHLAWAGSPILNDPLYGGLGEAGGFLALCAVKIAFTDPETGDRCEYGMSFS
jgi:23S rRNA pseudouridine1911/1915/1917 synthase